MRYTNHNHDDDDDYDEVDVDDDKDENDDDDWRVINHALGKLWSMYANLLLPRTRDKKRTIN